MNGLIAKLAIEKTAAADRGAPCAILVITPAPDRQGAVRVMKTRGERLSCVFSR